MSNISESSGYFSRPDGVSGMNVSALADFCYVEQQTITQLLNRIRDSDPITNSLEDCLKPYAGKDLRLITNDPQGRMIILDEACQAILEYYVFDARFYKGKDLAKNNFRVISKGGMRLFVWSKTGYQPFSIPQYQQPQEASYWYKRLGLAMSSQEKPLQAGYFCIYLEMMRFFSELENRLEYIVPDVNLLTEKYVVPDISIGLRFNEFLRSEDKFAYEVREKFLGSGKPIDFRDADNLKSGYRPAGANFHEILYYKHVYPKESHGNDNEKDAKSYPNEYKSIFHYYLEEHYIPDHCLPYIEKRDPEGIQQVRQTISLMPDKAKAALSGTLVGRFIQGLLPPNK